MDEVLANLILTEEVDVVCGSNKKWLIEKGYNYQKGETIRVKIEDLPNGSKKEIKILCDYCKRNIINLPYSEYNRRKGKTIRSIIKIKNFCCNDCKQELELKYLQSFFEKEGCVLLSKKFYGSNRTLEYQCSCGELSTTSYYVFKKGHRCKKCGTIEGATTRKNNKYNEIKKMFDKSNCVLLTTKEEYNEIRNTVRYICECGKPSVITPYLFKQGTRCFECGQKKKIKTNLKLYGTENPMQNKKIRQKAFNTLYANNNMPISLQQMYLHNILGGELNYLFNSSFLDIGFPEFQIYIEYDGGLHDGKVKFGLMSEEEFKQKEINRRYALYRRGWKEIKIISRKDNLPLKDKIKEMFNFAKNHLKKHSWIIFDIDNNLVKSSQFKKYYNFGKTERIRRDGKKFQYLIEKYKKRKTAN